MKTLYRSLASLLALLCAPAFAQVCTGYSATGPTVIVDAAPEWAALPCTPDFIGGTGRGYATRTSTAGVVGWLWCPSGTGWALRWGVMTWADAAPILADLPAALIATDKRAAIAAIGDKYLTRDITDPELKAIWCPHWAAMKATRPTATEYIVAPWPGATYRSTYSLINGVRVTVSNGRVAILTNGQPTPADCSIRVVEGSTMYCSVLGKPAVVAAAKAR